MRACESSKTQRTHDWWWRASWVPFFFVDDFVVELVVLDVVEEVVEEVVVLVVVVVGSVFESVRSDA